MTDIVADVVARLPPDVQPYRHTDVFTEASVPAALLAAHRTKDGAWALIHVLEGELAYWIEHPGRPVVYQFLTPETPPGVIEPAILHRVEPLGPVRFYVEFHRRPPAAP